MAVRVNPRATCIVCSSCRRIQWRECFASVVWSRRAHCFVGIHRISWRLAYWKGSTPFHPFGQCILLVHQLIASRLSPRAVCLDHNGGFLCGCIRTCGRRVYMDNVPTNTYSLRYLEQFITWCLLDIWAKLGPQSGRKRDNTYANIARRLTLQYTLVFDGRIAEKLLKHVLLSRDG